MTSVTEVATTLQGIGIGRGLGIGPVLRMPDPLPEPADTTSGLTPDAEKVRAAGARLIVATPRVQKPGEEGYDKRFERLKPDGILARHLGAVEHFRRAADLDCRRSGRRPGSSAPAAEERGLSD